MGKRTRKSAAYIRRAHCATHERLSGYVYKNGGGPSLLCTHCDSTTCWRTREYIAGQCVSIIDMCDLYIAAADRCTNSRYYKIIGAIYKSGYSGREEK